VYIRKEGSAVMNFLKKDDVIELKEGHEVYASVLEHLVYSSKKGSSKLTNTNIVVGGDFSYFKGKYVVVKTKTEGGGGGHGKHDTYPEGHRVYCVSVDDNERKINFYQSGCFTAMIEDIKPIGRASLEWVIKDTV
jgi:hypothetical protein